MARKGRVKPKERVQMNSNGAERWKLGTEYRILALRIQSKNGLVTFET